MNQIQEQMNESDTQAVVQFHKVSKRYYRGMVLPSFREMVRSFLRGPRAFVKSLANNESNAFFSLHDATFEMEAGQSLGIIGANGAGKSTLLKIVAGITDYTSGQMKIRGRVGALIEVGAGFHPELSGRDNIFQYGAIMGMKRREVKEKFNDIVEFSGIDPAFLDTPVKKYSNGMYVRLAFSVASHIDPDILLIDEVLAVGDTAFQMKCLERISKMMESGTTILFVSHDMLKIRQICPKALYLEKGEVVAYGDTENIIAQYLQRTTEPENAGPAEIPESTKSENIRILSVAMTAEKIRTGDTMEILVTLAAKKETVDFGVNASFYLGGTMVSAFSSQEEGLRFRAKTGEHELRLTLPAIALAPGTYRMSLGLTKAGVSYYDLRPKALVFLVEPKGKGGGGIFHLEHQWQPTGTLEKIEEENN